MAGHGWDALRGRAAGLPREVWVLTLNNFFVAVGFGVMMPVLPVFARMFGVSNFRVSWVISAFALCRLVTSPWCGRVIGRIGDRLALGLGIALVAVSSLAAGMAGTFWQLVVYRGLGGIGSALFGVAAMSLLLKVTPTTMRGRGTGLYQSGFLLGGMAGPAIGGLVAGISISAPFYFYAATLVVGGVACLVYIRPERVAEGVARAGATLPVVGRPLRTVLRDIRYQAALVANFAQGWQSFGVRSSLIPLFVTEVLLLGREWTGYAFAVAAVAQALALVPAGRWTDTVGRRPIMVAGGVLCGLGAIAMPYAPNIVVLIGILCVYGVGSAFYGTAPTASVGDAVGPKSGTPIALFSMSADIGVIVGPMVAGLMADRIGMHSAFLLGGCMLLAAAAFALLMPAGAPGLPGYRGTRDAAAADEARTEQLTEEHVG